MTCLVADGWEGVPQLGEFDAINVAAACDALPAALFEQLRPGGRTVAPVGDDEQHLTLITRTAEGGARRETLEPVRFVPLVRPGAG